jgi:hypothetical protein
MGFVQAGTSGQLGSARVLCSVDFDNDNAQSNVIAAILGWEDNGPDPTIFRDTNVNDYIFLPVQHSGGHFSQTVLCPTCKPGPNTLRLEFPSPGGEHPSISMAEYPPSVIQALKPNAIGSGLIADAGQITLPLAATVVQLTDSTQNTFTEPVGYNRRTPFGDHGPIRQSIVDADLIAGTYDPQTTLGASAPWATTVLALVPKPKKRAFKIGTVTVSLVLLSAGVDISVKWKFDSVVTGTS